MAINKKLIVFKQYSNYLKEKANGNIQPYSWILIKDEKKLISNGVEIESVDWDKVQQMIDVSIDEMDLENKLTDYATKEFVQEEIGKVDVSDQLKDYALKSELPESYDDTELKNRVATLEAKEDKDTVYDDTQVKADIKNLQDNKADKSDLDEYAKVAKTSVIVNENDEIIPKLIIDFSDNILNENGERIYTAKEIDANFATKKELEDKIAEINVGGGSTDLTNYFTKEEIRDITDSFDEQLIEINNTLGECASTDSLNELQNIVSGKANKSEVYTKTEVDNKISNIIKTYTQEEFDALTEEEKNNGIIIIL